MKNKIGILYFQQGADFLVTLQALIGYHLEKQRELLEIYANPEQLLEVQEINGIRTFPDKQLMKDHFWLITENDAA